MRCWSKLYGASPTIRRHLQSCDLHRMRTGILAGDPDPTYQYIIRGAPESLDANGDAPFHPTDKRIHKKLENHGHMVALYSLHYNFCRVHKTLGVTPAMEAGLTDHAWAIEELLSLLGV